MKIILIMLASLFLCACGEEKTTVDLTADNEQKTEQTLQEKNEFTIVDKEVEVIMPMLSFDEEETIEEYVKKLQEQNPDQKYSIYNDEYYSHVLKNSERREMVEQMLSKEFVEETFKDIFESEEYNGAFLKIEYDELFKEVTIFADKAKYESGGLMMYLGPVLSTSLYSQSVQAYSLVPVEKREFRLVIIDESSGEMLYSSDEIELEENEEENLPVDPEEKIYEINNWYDGKIWRSLLDFDSYRQRGLDCTGAKIDIDFAYEKFEKEYKKLEEYDLFINSLGEEYNEFKDTWSKMKEQLEIIYFDLTENGVEHDGSYLDLDLLNQYGSYFWDLVYSY